ncbi:MAG: PH domain-containing protein [Pirellulaceae bacterium]|nr:PH domain-containing protein [Pirellulaceae bacterium]
MKRAIAGVVPREVAEVPVMTVWPSIAAYPSGRFLGTLYNWRGGTYIFRLGNLLALASIPHALALYFYRILPYVGTRYTLTNRRVVVQRGLMAMDDKSVDLDRFDRIEIQVQLGQEWFQAGDLVFFQENTETFRLDGVSRPEAFRQVCIKSHEAYVGLANVLQQQVV